MRRVEISYAEQAYLSGVLRPDEPISQICQARYVVVPPVVLEQVELLDAEALERTVNCCIDVLVGQLVQRIPVCRIFGVNLNLVRVAQGAAKLSQCFFDADVDVGAVKSCKAMINQIGENSVNFFLRTRAAAMIRCQLPATVNDTRD